MTEDSMLFEELGTSCDENDSDSDTGNVRECEVGVNVLTDAMANLLYQEAGTAYTEKHDDHLTVLPKPTVMYSEAEQLISQAKFDLNISFPLDPFQIQALLGKVKLSIIIFIV